MRLWTLHPRYLDAAGLVALWREALLAKAVLRGQTSGYRNHPQLARFRAAAQPIGALNAYLRVVYVEARRRGYRFTASKLRGAQSRVRLPATRGQLAFEWQHLLRKLRVRSPEQYRRLVALSAPRAHPQFALRAGPIASWEKVSGRAR